MTAGRICSLTYYGKNVLYHNNGDGTFTDVSQKAGVAGKGTRWNTGCSVWSITIATAISTCSSPTTSTWTWPQRPCRNRGGVFLYKVCWSACGPPGLQGGIKHSLSQ